LRDRAEIKKLRDFLDATAAEAADPKVKPGKPNAEPGSEPPPPDDRKALAALVGRIAARPGFEQFKVLSGSKPPAQATLSAQREIARVLSGKLQAESEAVVLIDQRRANFR